MREEQPDLKSHGAVLAEEQDRVPGFKEEWEQTALARLVATRLIEYRVQHGLTQRQLAERLSVKQPFVARLESGERNPEFTTLVRISRELAIEFAIGIRPAQQSTSTLLAAHAAEDEATHSYDGVSVVVASEQRY